MVYGQFGHFALLQADRQPSGGKLVLPSLERAGSRVSTQTPGPAKNSPGQELHRPEPVQSSMVEEARKTS